MTSSRENGLVGDGFVKKIFQNRNTVPPLCLCKEIKQKKNYNFNKILWFSRQQQIQTIKGNNTKTEIFSEQNNYCPH